jgi:hypothetical protein
MKSSVAFIGSHAISDVALTETPLEPAAMKRARSMAAQAVA